MPALVRIGPSSTYSTSGVTRTAGKQAASSSANSQCVVAVRPSSRPAAARANAPTHTDATRAPLAEARRNAATTAGEGSARGKNPGTITVSATSVAFRPAPISTSNPDVERTAPGCSVQTVKP